MKLQPTENAYLYITSVSTRKIGVSYADCQRCRQQTFECSSGTVVQIGEVLRGKGGVWNECIQEQCQWCGVYCVLNKAVTDEVSKWPGLGTTEL